MQKAAAHPPSLPEVQDLYLGPDGPDLDVRPAQAAPRKNFIWKKTTQETDLARIAKTADSTLTEIDADITSAIEPKVEDTFQRLYQRKAQLSKVADTHEKWRTELNDIESTKFLPYQNKLNELADAIALLASEKEIATTISRIQQLEKRLHFLFRKNQGLILILQDVDHRQMLEFYKKLIKGCENLSKISTIHAKVKELATFFKEIEGYYPILEGKIKAFPPKLKAQIETLQEELLQFFHFTIRHLETSVPANDANLQAQVVGLKKSIEKELRRFTANIPDNASLPPAAVEDLQLQPADELVDKFVKSCKVVDLPANAQFRCGQWGTRLPFVGYRLIMNETAKLQGIAQKMLSLVKHIDTRTQAICAGNLKPEQGNTLEEEKQMFENGVSLLEREIKQVRDTLYQKDFSDQVHAGLYYVAELLAHAQEVRVHIELFGRYGVNSFHPYIIAQSKLIQYLNPDEGALQADKGYFTSFEAVKRLFSAALSCAELEYPDEDPKNESVRLKRKTYSMLDDTISKIGPKTLGLTDEEKTLPYKILSGVPLCIAHDVYLPDSICSYLTKRISQFLFTTQLEFDPEIDFILHTLATHESFKAFFTRTRHNDPFFRELLRAYGRYSDWETSAVQMAPLASIFSLLYQNDYLPSNEQEKALKTLFSYCQAQQQDLELSQQPRAAHSKQQESRFVWARAQIKERFKQVKDAETERLLGKENAKAHKDGKQIAIEETTREELYPEFFLSYSAQPRMSRAGAPADAQGTFPNLFYKTLVMAFWSANDYDRCEASNAILSTVSTVDPNILPRKGAVGKLLHKWLLDHFHQDSYHSDKFKQLVQLFIAEYLALPTVQHPWRKVYDIGFMEIAVVSALLWEEDRKSQTPTTPQGNISQLIRTFRDTMNLLIWREVVLQYKEFRTLFESPVRVVEGNAQHEKAKKIYQNVAARLSEIEKPNDALVMTNLGIAFWCKEHMEFYLKNNVTKRDNRM